MEFSVGFWLGWRRDDKCLKIKSSPFKFTSQFISNRSTLGGKSVNFCNPLASGVIIMFRNEKFHNYSFWCVSFFAAAMNSRNEWRTFVLTLELVVISHLFVGILHSALLENFQMLLHIFFVPTLLPFPERPLNSPTKNLFSLFTITKHTLMNS